MAETKVIMPQMGESIFEGTITKWLKKKGDTIQRDEPLFEISTDKIDSEIPAPASGVLQDILVKEGQTVQINTVVAVIGDGAGKPAAEQPPAQRGRPKSRPKRRPGKKNPRKSKVPLQSQDPLLKLKGTRKRSPAEGIRSSPLVRRIAKGAQGRSVGDGRKRHRYQRPHHQERHPELYRTRPRRPESCFRRGGSARAVRRTRRGGQSSTSTHEVLRRSRTRPPHRDAEIHRRTHGPQPKTSAHVSTFFEVDCARILKAKDARQAEFECSGVRLTVTPFFIQAAVNALKRFPIVNSSLDGETIVYKRAINIGIAVNLDWGLIVPVIKNADEKNLLASLRHSMI